MNIRFDVDTTQLNRLAVSIATMRNRFSDFTAKAMTYAAYDSQRRLRDETPKYISNPTRWTLNSTFVRKATPADLTVSIGFKDGYYSGNAPAGVPTARYLQPIVAGGRRSQKSSEVQLSRFSAAFQNRVLIPTNKDPLPLNTFGNITGGKYKQVLSRIGAFTAEGSNQNASGSTRSRRRRSQSDYFISWRTGAPIAIHARVGDKPKGTGGKGSPRGGRPITSNLPRGRVPVFIVGRSPTYTPQFPVERIVTNRFAQRFPSVFERLVFTGK